MIAFKPVSHAMHRLPNERSCRLRTIQAARPARTVEASGSRSESFSFGAALSHEQCSLKASRQCMAACQQAEVGIREEKTAEEK